MLGLLLAAYLLDSLDRSIFGILLQPICDEFALSDTQLGLLGGLAFAVFYSVLGLPAALWADRTDARRVLALSLLLWSGATILCGAAASFALLLLARMVTAIGESGANPTSQSILADCFAPGRLARVFGIFALGAPAGAMLGSALGGLGNEVLGWRATLALAGLPGLLLAPVIFFTVRDPARSGTRATPAPVPAPGAGAALKFHQVLPLLWRHAAFRHLGLACALHSAAIYAAATFNAPFLMRSHGWGSAGAGTLLAANGACGILGAVAGGALAGHLCRARADRAWLLRVPAFASLALVPVELLMYLSGGSWPVVCGLMLSGLLSSVFFGPAFAATQAMAGTGMRATAAAALVFVKTLIGMGLGPLLVGFISDLLAPTHGADSLRYALLCTAVFNAWSVAHFWRAASRHASEPGIAGNPHAGATPAGLANA